MALLLSTVMCHYLRTSNLQLLLSTGEETSDSKDAGCVDEADPLGKNYTSLDYSES